MYACMYKSVVSKKKFSHVECFLYYFELFLLQNAEAVAQSVTESLS